MKVQQQEGGEEDADGLSVECGVVCAVGVSGELVCLRLEVASQMMSPQMRAHAR